ncbi:bi-domain-containing oxidoreductase [Larkinella bovis]|uniref:Bi-domain-containing oxidoreductase n=1 Tax=Larkinella bovis TaxID=683041 RepID=A0ABW0I9G9_9BACT
MRQLIQNLKTGETLLEEVPTPQVRRGQVLIRTRMSLVSLGTERMLVEFGRASLIAKARQQPDKVKQVLEKIRTDGLVPTLEAVFNKLDQPLPMGYCNVGEVIAVGEDITDLAIGDRVASNGHHAEVVCVPRNLVALIPDGVTNEQAAFTVIGSIGLQGIRLLNPTLGETVVVVGLGLIGLLTAELLRLNGCRVIGLDVDERKLELARQKGIIALHPAGGSDPVKAVLSLTDGVGADGVVITASAKTDELISQAARMSRKRGRIILVGVIGLNLSRAEFYEKELSFQVSCSYGPGRYDDSYEQQGHDYPLPFVRWTENRNFTTILQLLASGQLDVQPLITEVVPFEAFHSIYGSISHSRAVASLLRYPDEVSTRSVVPLRTSTYEATKTGTVIGLIGAGNFTSAMILPSLKTTDARLKSIASANGLNALLLAKKYGIASSTTDYREILNDPAINLIVITTRHHQHARMTMEALRAGKHVFVEKPLAIYEDELDELIDTYQQTDKTVLVGFNRRFSPHSQKMKALLGESATVPMNVVATMNAGFIPAHSWVHDRRVGGGRILGEACHYVDLISFLTGSRLVAVCMNGMGRRTTEVSDSATLLLQYENGSTGVINYFANGSKAYAKERVEVFSQERTLILDNFRSLKGYGFKGFSSLKTRQDKGHRMQFQRLVEQVRTGGLPLIPFDEIVTTSRTTLAALRSLREKGWVEVPVGVSERSNYPAAV